MSRRHDAHFVGLHVAQEAKRADGVGNVSFDVPVQQPSQRIGLPADVPPRLRPFELVPHEREVQAGVLQALALHPRVAWAHRFNTGGFTDTHGHTVRFAFTGCSDIIGQLKTGQFLAVECKRPGGRTKAGRMADQMAFLDRVRAAGGVAFIATDIRDVARNLDARRAG